MCIRDSTYTVTVEDGNGCFSSAETFIGEDSLPIETNNDPPTCADGSDGTLTIEDGQPTFMYSIDGTNFQASPIFNGLPVGIYDITIQDGDCVYVGTGEVESPEGIFVGDLTIMVNNLPIDTFFNPQSVIDNGQNIPIAVSYTHLTLPTNREV